MTNINKYDAIVVGTGFAGAITAFKFAKQNKKVLVLEKRNEVSGNMADFVNEDKIIIQKYGPHVLRANDKKIYDFLEQFGEFAHYRHLVNGKIDDNINIPLPFNINSLKIAFKENFDQYLKILIDKYGYEAKIGKKELLESGLDDVYEFISVNIFENYTNKQWKSFRQFVDLEAILSRVPVMVLTNRDGYFTHKYQKMPSKGFKHIFDNMLNHENIDIMLNSDAKEHIKLFEGKIFFDDEEINIPVVYSGPIDELFDYQFGQLPYLSVNFEFNTYKMQTFQNIGTQNYPNHFEYTRETEFKYLYNQELDSDINNTVTVKEVSQEFELGKNERFYPIPGKNSQEMYNKYAEVAQNYSNLHLLGRLAQYKYYDMDHIIDISLNYFEEHFTK